MAGRILCFGASTMWGAWDTEKHGWITHFQLSIEKRKEYYEVYNLGVSGDTSPMLLERMDAEAKARLNANETEGFFLKKDNVIIISIGGNDSGLLRNEPYVSLKKYKENLSKILVIAQKYADNIAFIGEGPTDDKRTDPVPWDEECRYIDSRAQEYSDALEEFCKKKGVAFINIYQPLKNKKIWSDGLHLNAKGHQIVAELVEQKLISEGLVK